MPTARDMLEQLKIDDFGVLKQKVEAIIANIADEGFQYKHIAKQLFDDIDIETDIGKLDLVVLAYVLYKIGAPENLLQNQNAALDLDCFFENLATYQVIMSKLNAVDDVDVIDPDDVPKVVPKESTHQAGELALILAINAKTKATDALETMLASAAVESHCAAVSTVASEIKKRAFGALRAAVILGIDIKDVFSNVRTSIDEAALHQVQRFLFDRKQPEKVKKSVVDDHKNGWQAPLP